MGESDLDIFWTLGVMLSSLGNFVLTYHSWSQLLVNINNLIFMDKYFPIYFFSKYRTTGNYWGIFSVTLRNDIVPS